MKAFSFSSILKNFGKQLSSLASQMPWCNLRFNLGSMSVLSRVNPLFSRTFFGTSLGTSRRVWKYVACMLLVLVLGVGEMWGDTAYGFENNNTSQSGYPTSAGDGSRTISSSIKRTGSYSLEQNNNNTSDKVTKVQNLPATFKGGVHYIHSIAYLRKNTSNNVTLKGNSFYAGSEFSSQNVNIALSSDWTRVVNKGQRTGNSQNYTLVEIRYKTNTATKGDKVYIDDIVVYVTEDDDKTDLKKPGSATSASATTSSISWTCGTDDGDSDNGATGIQATLIFHRTGGSVGGDDLTLNDQGIYSLTSTEGPSTDQSGNWTLLSASVGAAATSYSGTFEAGHEYAIVHRDLAYNYSTPTYVTVPTVSWKLKGSFDDWGDGYAMTGGETVSVTRTLEANYRYEFKFHNGNEYYGNNGAIVTNISNWDFNTEGNNCVLYTGPAGEYTFTFNTTTKKATITYPEVEHPNANYVYFAKPNDWDAVRLYNYTSDSYRMSDWDGSPTITTKTTICGNEYYYCAANTMFEYIIWRDNSSHQSEGLGTSNGLGKYFDFSVNTTNWSEFSTYTITFNGNSNTGGSMSNLTGIACGANQAITANAYTRTGYSFAGWKANVNVTIGGSTVTAGTVIANSATIQNISQNITLTAQWTAKTCNITFDKESGSGGSDNVTATYGSAMPSITKPTRTGYTFEGYWDGDNGTGNQYYKADGTSNKNWDKEAATATLYAKWNVNSYTLTWDVNGGNALTGEYTSGTVVYGTTIIKPSDPTREGYNFAGWDPEVVATMPAETTTYTAQWEAETYTVTLNTNGGTINADNVTSYTYGVGATLPANVTKDGFTFGGWYESADFQGNAVTIISTTATGNKEYWAKWTAETYTVTFNANGGNVEPTSATQAVSGAAITLPTPTRDGHIFAGWYTAASGGTKIGDADDSYTPTANITIYAQWEKVLVFNLPNDFNKTTQEWSVSSSNSANKLQNYAYVLVEVPEATSEGSVYWKGEGNDADRNLYMYTNGTLDNKKSFEYSTSYVSQTFGNSNIITIGGKYYLKFSTTADWKAENVKIDLGGAIQTCTLTNVVNTDGYGTVSPASVSEIPSGMTTSSNSNTYTVNETTVTATPTANTAQYTYAFSSWSGLPATVTEDATVTANFTRTVNKYTITFINGETVLQESQVEYGTIPEYNGETPIKAADAENTYTFEGWSPAISAVTGNATYTATFTATPIEIPEPSGECEIIIKATPTGETSATVSGSLKGNAYFKGQTDYKLGSTGHYIGVSLKSGETFQSGDKIILDVEKVNDASKLYLYSDAGKTALVTLSITLTTGENKFDIPNEVVGESALYIYRVDSKCNPTINSFAVCRPTTAEPTTYNVTTTLTNVTANSEFPATITADGSIERTITASDGYTLPSDITVTGATYTWNASTGALTITNVTDNVTITIVGVENTPITPEPGNLYTVTFNTNGGSEVSPITQASAGAEIILPTPTKDGYEFVGWYIGGILVTADTYIPAADITATAAWKENCILGTGGEDNTTHSTTFVGSNSVTGNWSGSGLGSTDFKDETKALKLPTQKTLTYTFPTVVQLRSVKVVMAFTSADANLSWSLTAKDNNGNEIKSSTQSTTMGEKNVQETFNIPLEATNVKTVVLNNSSSKQMNVGEITFTIVISSGSGECYYVTYNGNGADGGYVNDANAYAANEEVTTLANDFTRAGYTFTGWNTAADGSGASYAAGGTFTITGNTELFAQWIENTNVDLSGCTGTTITYNLLTPNNPKPSQTVSPAGVITELTGATAQGTATTTNTGSINNSFADYSVLYGASEGSDNAENGVKFTFTVPTGYVFKPSAINTNLMCYGTGKNGGTQNYEFYGTLSDGATTINGTALPGTANGANEDIEYSDITGKTLSGTVTLRLNAVKVGGEYQSFRIKSPITIEGELCSAQTYAINYNPNGGSGAMESTSNVVAENEFTREGYTFDGWNTKTDGTGTSYAAGEIVASNLTLYAQWKCIKPEFTVSYEQTEYTIDDDASAITVTVTAGNSGGVTYQWYSSTTNDRNNGTAIENNATSASYIPYTTSVGTIYYWCEIENTCTSVQTAMIAITVRANKNTPSVTWNWFDAAETEKGTINYGGGNYTIAAQITSDGWNGTLTADMLTAPTGINIYNVAVQGNTISATFDVTTSFDSVANPTTIPFYLSLPETDDYYSLVSEGDVTYEACTTGGGSEYRIPVNEKSVSSTNPNYRWDTENVGWITWDQGGGTIKSESVDVEYNDFSYRTSSGKQIILIYSKIPQVKRIRIYGYGSNATELLKISTGAEYNKYKELSVAEYAFTNNVKSITNRENGVIEISFTTPLAENTYVQFSFSSNAKFYGVELETDGGGTLQPTLQWSNNLENEATVEKTQSAVNFTYTASLTGENSNTLGTITYSSSNTNVATVNPTTGEVEITATGTETLTTTITATLARSGCYQGATATYTISVAGLECKISAGTLALTDGAENKCPGKSVTLTLTGYTTENTTLQWYKGNAIIEGATNATYTTTEPGVYSVLVTDNNNACEKRSNTITITNISAEASVTNIVNTWYIKNGRLTPEIALWKLEEGTTFQSVTTSDGWADGTGFNSEAFSVKDGVVYLTGTPPKENTGEDKAYTLTLNVEDVCGGEHTIPTTITIVHQKNTDKHVLAFVVGNTEKKDEKYVAIGKGFTESIPASQTTNVSLYNEIAKNFEVQPTNIYSTDDEQKIKEYYSQYDILCITDYPNTQTKGANSKSYVDAIGSLIDIRPILTMEAFVSKLANWKAKGISGNPKSPTTRQYNMLLQCKDHEIFAGTSLVDSLVDGETMYRVTMVDATKEDYVNLDKVEGDHQEKEGYKYGSNPALQGFTYTSAMSSMLPIGIIDDGAGNNLQVGLERQHEIEARMMVIGVNSYAMERLTDDGEKVIINALKYLMKKNAEDISDCSIYFDNNGGTGDGLWSSPVNWGPSRNSLPQSSQEARILAPCEVSDYTAKVASVKIVTGGTYKYQSMSGTANGSLTIAPNGALVVKGRIQAATAPNYLEARNTDVKDLIVQSDEDGNGALIFNNAAGDTKATVAMYSKAYTNIDKDGKKKKHWQYCAIPIHEAPIPEFFWGAYTYLWEEPNGAWTRKRDGATLYEWQPIGVSYGAVMDEQPTYRFYGELTSTDEQSFDLTYTDGTYGGMNLIGNSWTAPINIAAFEDADFEGNVTKEILIHNTGRREDVGSDYNYGTVENTSEKPGQWIAIPIGAPKVPEYDGVKVISSLQAFQINVTAASTLTLNYDRLVRSTKQEDLTTPMRAPSRKAQVATIVPKEVRMLKVRVADKKNHADIYIFDHDGFTPQYDNGWDARFGGIVDNYPSLSVLTQDGEMSMAAIPTIDGTTLGFSSGTDNEYMISFKYTGEETLYLNDMQLKKSTQINNVNQYYFTTDVNDMYNRFVISKESFDSPNISTGLANIVTDGNGLQVTNPNQENLQVILIDAAGRMCSIYNTAEPMFKVELPATQGVYMINVKGETTNIVRKVVK